MPLVVTLVHGTWAKDAAWVREDSTLCKALKKSLRDSIWLRPFWWSGGYSFSAREVAANDLRTFLNEGLALFPHANHAIIAHSHGGNVVLLALRDEVLRGKIEGIVCLSTPFLTATHRDFGEFSGLIRRFLEWSTGTAAAVAVVVVIPFVRQLFIALADTKTTSTYGYLFVLGFLAIVFLVQRTIHLMISRWLDLAHVFQKRQACSFVDDLRLLVIRPRGDEASSALIATQFIGWLATKVWKSITGMFQKIRETVDSWEDWFAEEWRSSLGACLKWHQSGDGINPVTAYLLQR